MYELDDFLKQHDIYVTLYDLPCSSHGFVVKHRDQYIILLNAKLGTLQQRKVFLHEIAHVLLQHFENPSKNDEAEANQFMELAYKFLQSK